MKIRLIFTLAATAILAGCSTTPVRNELDAPGWTGISQETARYQQADEELNRTYNNLLSSYDENDQELLRKAESAWIVMRDAEAELAVSHTGGWGRTANYYRTVTLLTKVRIRELQECNWDKDE